MLTRMSAKAVILYLTARHREYLYIFMDYGAPAAVSKDSCMKEKREGESLALADVPAFSSISGGSSIYIYAFQSDAVSNASCRLHCMDTVRAFSR